MIKKMILILTALIFINTQASTIEVLKLEGETEDRTECEVTYTLENVNGILKTTRFELYVAGRDIISTWFHNKHWSSTSNHVTEKWFSYSLMSIGEAQLDKAYDVFLYGDLHDPKKIETIVTWSENDRDRPIWQHAEEFSKTYTCYF